MPDVELVAYETAVEKLCADWVLDVAKLLNSAGDAVSARTGVLKTKIKGLQVPQKSNEKEIAALPPHQRNPDPGERPPERAY